MKEIPGLLYESGHALYIVLLTSVKCHARTRGSPGATAGRGGRKFCHECTINKFTFQTPHLVYLTFRRPRLSCPGRESLYTGTTPFSNKVCRLI